VATAKAQAASLKNLAILPEVRGRAEFPGFADRLEEDTVARVGLKMEVKKTSDPEDKPDPCFCCGSTDFWRRSD